MWTRPNVGKISVLSSYNKLLWHKMDTKFISAGSRKFAH